MMDIIKVMKEFEHLDEFSKPSSDVLECLLLNKGVKLSTQLRALYFCRDLEKSVCTRILKAALDVHHDTFMRHEIAYVLGQAGCTGAATVLADLLKDVNEDPMVRHEAAEAIAALGTGEYIDLIKDFSEDPSVVVRDTCVLALHSLAEAAKKNEKSVPICACISAPVSTSAYRAVDPIACTGDSRSMEELSSDLLNEKLELHSRYEALFELRNRGTDEAAKVIGDALVKDTRSEVFRHECAFVLGQMQSVAAIDSLVISLLNMDEEPIVRHEAALALGSTATAKLDADDTDMIIETLKEYSQDPIKVVADSCEVALDYLLEAGIQVH